MISALLLLTTGCRQGDAGDAATPTFDAHAALMNPGHAAWSEPAPDVFRVRLETSKGTFVIEAHRAWAPYGVDRFYNLVAIGWYDDMAFFRNVAGFMIQFGINGRPAANAVWKKAKIRDAGVSDQTWDRVAAGVVIPR